MIEDLSAKVWRLPEALQPLAQTLDALEVQSWWRWDPLQLEVGIEYITAKSFAPLFVYKITIR